MSTFDGADLFGSGPHRFSLGPRGDQLALKAIVDNDPTHAGSQAIGPLDGEVIIRGRLVADTDADLQALLDDIAAKLTDPPTVGDLTTVDGTEYKDLAFVSFAPADRTDRGANVSLAYTARFLKFGGW